MGPFRSYCAECVAIRAPPVLTKLILGAAKDLFVARYLNSKLAEGEGFEPPVPFRVHRFSRPTVSTAHTSLRGYQKFTNQKASWRSERNRVNSTLERGA